MMSDAGLGKWVLKLFVIPVFCWQGLIVQSVAQSGQIPIARVSELPNLPMPYLMRDWKAVAIKYDAAIFGSAATGQFLPLMHIKPTGINYPALAPILLDTYVGSVNTGNQAEAINIIPALVGATLVGIDKSDQNGLNWIIKSKDFFNLANQQNVYLNGYSATSGSDWWYDLMPNVFFYQLFSLYPDDPDFGAQFTSVADQWLAAVKAMGGSTTPWQTPVMNYRGWNLGSMSPNNSGVVEPEAAGAIAWLLYHAWIRSGENKYLSGAQQAMEFLSGLTSNPSYELQLPYGAFAAAKMNAELGTNYDLQKMVNWCFDRGPLRGWGVVAGSWNGSSVSGLVGEANDAGNDYAFAMNGFQQAAALAPMVKYDKRFAHDIAKWILNLANASRLFYPSYLPEGDQDDYLWSSQHDPESVIAYEALKENWQGKQLYGTGDAKREGWAETNLGIYGSSHVGFLAAIVEPTDVEGILKLDVNKTDFFGQNDFPNFLLYNPHADAKQINIALGSAPSDIYDAISETVIQTDVAGTSLINVMPDEAMLLVVVPAGAALVEKDGKLYAGETIVDYNFGYNFEGKFRIKSLSAADTLAEFGQSTVVYSAVENETGPVTYEWYVNGVLFGTAIHPDFQWVVPDGLANYTVKLRASAGGYTVEDSVVIRAIAVIPHIPEISGFSVDSLWYYTGTNASVICRVKEGGEKIVTYSWTLPGGSAAMQIDSMLVWKLPTAEGVFSLFCEVTDANGLKATSQIDVLVKAPGTEATGPVAYYPFDGNVRDYTGNGHDAALAGPKGTDDARAKAGNAYRFITPADIISVPNVPALNFQDQISLAFWVKLDAVIEESFILSHGSWEERWKVSVTGEKKLRWTIKTAYGTKDLDSSFPLMLNRYYHVAAVYSGYSMELYIDGMMNGFIPATGQVLQTSKPLAFGRKDAGTTGYSLKGSLDEVRIYDIRISPDEIGTLPLLWNDVATGLEGEVTNEPFVFPNPGRSEINISSSVPIKTVDVWDLQGRKIYSSSLFKRGEGIFRLETGLAPGVFILRIETTDKVFYRKVIIN